MGTYVLVHGAWHGSWCWERVVAELGKRGHEAVAVDLPGRAGDLSPHNQITLAAHAESVCRTVQEQTAPVTLVGHSMGGVVISEAAERCPERIGRLVYVCAFLLADGQSLFDVAQADSQSLVGPNIAVDEQAGTVMFKPGAPLKEIFYGSCSKHDTDRAQAGLVAEPLAGFGTPVHTTTARFGRVPRTYVECLRDRAISPTVQRRMATDGGCQRVLTMDTDHSPFLSDPEMLTECLTAP